MNLDDYTIYVFIREDLPLGQDDIQSNHAAWHCGYEFGQLWQEDHHPKGIPFLVTIGVKSAPALLKVREKLIASNIRFATMIDSDVDGANPTSIATHPLDAEQKQALRKYQVRKYARHAPISQEAEAGTLNGGPRANTPVAQLREHLPSRQEVEGANPSRSAI